MSTETSQMHEIFFDQNPDAVFSFDLDGNFLSVNKAFLTLGECTLEEAQSTTFIAFLPPYEVERVVEHFKKAVSGEIQRYETDVINAKGNSLVISVTNFPIIISGEITGVYGIARDITELKKSEKELRRSEDTYRSIMQNALSAFLLTVPEGPLIDANKAALEMFGYTFEEFKQVARDAIIDHTDPSFIEFLALRQRTGNGKGEFTGIRKNGERFPCEYSSVVFTDINGNLRRSINIIDISERKAAEKDLHHKQELLNAIVNNADEGIAVADLNGRFLVFNEAMVELLGVQRIDSENYDWSNLFHIHYPHTRKKVPRNELPIVKTMRGETIKNQMFLIKNPVRGDVYMSVSSSAIRDKEGNIVASMVIDRDITQQVKYENDLNNAIGQLIESNERFTYAAQATSEAIWEWNMQQPDLFKEYGYKDLFGYEFPDNIGHVDFWASKVHPEDHIRIWPQMLSTREDASLDKWTIEYRFLKANNEYIFIKEKAILLRDEKGNLLRMIGSMQDITRQKTEEAELKLLADDLFKRNNELQQFGYVVSHNLRSPVANIMGITSLLEMDKDDPETVEQCTKDIKNAIHRLDDVIRDLSKILSITDGSAEIMKEEVDLAEILANVKTDLRDTIAHAEALIDLPMERLVLQSHKAYLYSVFYNLISNAIKYRSAAAPQIKISVETGPASAIITVSDNGLGIDLKKHADDIFKPYKRFNTGIEGKGLGLFLVKSHVEALKGKIEISSKPGKGTTFTITLPVNRG